MCPNQCPGLDECWGEEFESLYTDFEAEGKFIRQIPARELWNHILDSQMETGTPYMMYKGKTISQTVSISSSVNPLKSK